MTTNKYYLKQLAKKGKSSDISATSTKSSKYRGVCFDKSKNKWKASIRCEGKKIHIGLFFEEIEAAKAYDEKAKELHKEKAKLNFF